jgi:alpha-mannosidase
MPLYVDLDFQKKLRLPLINNPDFTIVCVKKMEYTDDLMIRGFNNSEKPIKLTFTDVNKQPVNVDLLNLKEKMVKHNFKDDIVNPYEIKTYRMTTGMELGND